MDLDAILALETGELSEEDEIRALQGLINSGTWSLQGAYGRAMMAAIEAGACALGEDACRDFWGNRIPSRWEVAPGTKGSPEFVQERSPFGKVLE